MTPRPVQHGVGSECGRRIHLRQQTIANGWTLRTDVDRDAGALDQCDEASEGETVRTPIWPRFSAGRASNFIPKQSENYTVSRSAAN